VVAESNWLVIELSEAGESASRAELEAALRTLLGESIEWFIPIHHEKMGSYVSTSVLFEGYVFIRDCDDSRNSIHDIREHRMFNRILQCGGRFQTVDSYKIGVLRKKLKNSIKREFLVGTQVKILEGVFTDLLGEVIGNEDEGRKVVVRVKRQSREWVVPLPSTSVREADKIEIPITSDSTGVESCIA
jgi:transcription antitermination factor NusG